MAWDKAHVGPLAAERLPQAPVRPSTRKWNAAPLDTRRQPRRGLDGIGVDAHRARASRYSERLDNAAGIDFGSRRKATDRGRSINGNDHRCGNPLACTPCLAVTRCRMASRSISSLRLA